jgi:hypothetical protein
MSDDKLKGTKDLVAETKETSRTALLYWVNSTTGLFGLNHTLTTLIEMISTMVEHQVPFDQLDRARGVIVDVIDDAVADAKAKEAANNAETGPKLKVVKKKKNEDLN